jgi:hypothetical protein
MKITFVKNIQFTRLTKVNGYLKEFNFRKPNGRPDSPFTVDTIDDRGNRIIFHMQKNDSHWKIVPQELPDWVQQLETVFHEMIAEELAAMEM